VRTAIRDISDAVDGMLTKDRMARIRSTRLAEVSALTNSLKQSRDMALRAHFDSSPVTWERVGYELEKVLDKDAMIVPELGTQYYKIYRQLKLGGSNKQRIGRTKGDALGWGLAAAFGVNLALLDRQVVALQGNGGFLFNQSEALWSIARYEAPMLIVIMNRPFLQRKPGPQHAQRRYFTRPARTSMVISEIRTSSSPKSQKLTA
jgi:thiamine pyrophosphate-dependent acetolactate synthase large subunit-like protein